MTGHRWSHRIRRWPLLAVAAILTLATTAQTQANTVATTKLEDDSQTITPDAMKPVECAAITVTAKRSGAGTFSGTTAAELITGSAGVDTITAAAGNDCVLGGGGNDSLNGGNGTDVCIGGAGTDTFTASCETQIQ